MIETSSPLAPHPAARPAAPRRGAPVDGRSPEAELHPTDSRLAAADSALPDTWPAAADHPRDAEDRAEGEERAINLGRRFFNLKTGFSFLLGIAILVTLFKATRIDPAALWQQLQQVDGRIYLMAVLCYALTFPFRGLRWQRLLRNVGSRLPLAPLTEVIFISWFVNSVLPGKVGDIYRGYLLKREYGLSLSRTVGTVVAERVVDLLGLVLLLGVTGTLVLRHRVAPAVDQILHVGWIGMAVLLLGLVVTYRFGERLMGFFPEPARKVYARFAHGTFSSFGTIRSLPLVAGLTVAAWSAEAGRLYFVMQALHVSIGPLAALFTVAAISLSLIVPTPGGLGGVEAAFALVLAVFGVPFQVALAVALLDRLISYYSLIVFGLPAFLFTQRGR